jgi:flagellin
MAVAGVSLSTSARANLSALQSTSSLLEKSQSRLATGYKVSSALDNATAFFASQGFLNRASDLTSIKDNLSTSLQTVKAATNAIDGITKIVQQAQGITTSALQTTNTAQRSAYATQFNGLRTQIDALVNDAVFNGINLLSGTGSIVVNFNENATSTLSIASIQLDTTGLSLGAAAGAFKTDANINSAVSQLTTALSTLRANAASFGNNSTVIQTRQDFTKGLIDTLQAASDNLVLADTNEEGANLQALQARQQLSVVSLGISGQQAQAILRLF